MHHCQFPLLSVHFLGCSPSHPLFIWCQALAVSILLAVFRGFYSLHISFVSSFLTTCIISLRSHQHSNDYPSIKALRSNANWFSGIDTRKRMSAEHPPNTVFHYACQDLPSEPAHPHIPTRRSEAARPALLCVSICVCETNYVCHIEYEGKYYDWNE